MLDYEWGNPTGMMLPGEEPESAHHHGPDPARQPFLDHYAPSAHPAFADHHHHQFLANPHNHHHNDLSSSAAASHSFAHHFGGANNNNSNPSGQSLHHHSPLYDPRAFSGASYAPMLSLEAGPPFMLVPKAESAAELIGGSSARIGLNLGGRTYFSSAEDDFMSRLYRRPRAMEVPSSAANSPRCQSEGCNADLSHAKHYHRRHKVCEFHSKASTVIAAGLTQRFCQQCSRFHLLSEFDNGKRSCRKRLADHNRRRRKTQQQPNQDSPKLSSSSQPENSRTNPSSDHGVARSPPDSGAQSSSSVTVAVSPPRMSLDCFRQRSTYQATASSGSSSSLFFSSG